MHIFAIQYTRSHAVNLSHVFKKVVKTSRVVCKQLATVALLAQKSHLYGDVKTLYEKWQYPSLHRHLAGHWGKTLRRKQCWIISIKLISYSRITYFPRKNRRTILASEEAIQVHYPTLTNDEQLLTQSWLHWNMTALYPWFLPMLCFALFYPWLRNRVTETKEIT